MIRPYLETHHNFFNQEAIVLDNDRIFDIIKNVVQKMRYNFNHIDKHLIQSRQSDSKFVYLKYAKMPKFSIKLEATTVFLYSTIFFPGTFLFEIYSNIKPQNQVTMVENKIKKAYFAFQHI